MTIAIQKDDRVLLIADRHQLYAPWIAQDFEHYFNAVESFERFYNGEATRVVDYSEPATHQLLGSRLRITTPSFLEPWAGVEQYLELLYPQHDEVVWDLGGYVGVATIAFAERARHVVTVEPDPANFRALLANLRAYALANVTVWPAAIAPETGPVAFCADGTCGAAIASVVGSRTPPVTVLGVTLEDLAAMSGMEPACIKLDIEGAELGVLRGAHAFLSRCRPRLLVEPHYVEGVMCTTQLVDLLTTYGYRVRLEPQAGQSTPLLVALP